MTYCRCPVCYHIERSPIMLVQAMHYHVNRFDAFMGAYVLIACRTLLEAKSYRLISNGNKRKGLVRA